MRIIEVFNHSEEAINRAAQLLLEGDLVAFPTETVYGLGAIATNEAAVKSVYLAKGRPSDNPLIVHVASIAQVADYVAEITETALKLMKTFWPGPLTLILPLKEGSVASAVTGGQTTLAVRMPNNALTLKLIEAVGIGLVGPSANTSGKPSPTSAAHVIHDLEGKIAGVVDGGETQIGLESTVIDMTNSSGPIILRPGAVSEAAIEATLGISMSQIRDETEAPKAPGMKYTHYAPTAPVWVVNELTIKQALEQAKGNEVCLIATDQLIERYKNQIDNQLSLGQGLVEQASHLLFSSLRQADASDADVIMVEAFPETGLGVAYMNRLNKAASRNFVS